MSDDTREETRPSLGELSGAAVFTIGLISAWLYVTGWSYTYQYLERFGIPLLMVDIPKEHYLVYGSVVARQFPAWLLTIAAAVTVLVTMRQSLARLLGRFAVPITVLAVIGLFWLGRAAGVAAAMDQYQQQRANDYAAYRRVQIWPAEDGLPQPGAPPTESLAQGCYRLLLHNQDRLFLFRSFKEAGAADLPVLIVPWDQVGAIRVLPDFTSCK